MTSLKSWAKDSQNSEKIIILLGILGYGIIIFRYRIQMGDFGDFAKAGKLIWANEDPYSQLMYVNSPVSAVIVYGLSKVIPFIFVPAFWQILNILGLFLFARTVISKNHYHLLPIAFSIFAFLNVTRALFANVQVTGLVLGLVALGLILCKRGKSKFIAILPLWLAVEMKPQLAIGFIAILLFQGKIKYLRIFALGLYTLFSHALLELKFSGDINRLWIEKLIKYSSASLKEGFEISIWKVIAIHTDQFPFIRIASLIALVAILCSIVFVSLKCRTDVGLFLALIFPILNSYLHLYDLAFLSLCVIIVALISKEHIYLIGTLLLLQIFPLTPLGQVSSFMILGTFLCLLPWTSSKKMQLVGTILLTLPIFLAASYVLKNESQEMQIAETLIFPMMITLALNNKKFVSLFSKV